MAAVSPTPDRVIEPPRDAPQVIAFPPALFGGTLALGLVAHGLYPVRPLPTTLSRAVGLVVLGLSLALARGALGAMRRAGTNVNPREPALALVVDGPFRFSRNPLYLATTGLYISVALLVDALWPLILVPPLLIVIDLGVVRAEERYLEGKFGESYSAYRARVRRWI